MRNLTTTLLATLLWLAGLALPAQASESATLSVDAVREQTLAFARTALQPPDGATRSEISVPALDPKLRLRHCEQPLGFEPQRANPRSGRQLVKVRCDDAQPWAIFVPVKVQYWMQVVTTARPVARNSALQAADLRVEEVQLQQLRDDYLTRLDQAIGMVSRRSLPAGASLSQQLLQLPKLVKRGDSVVISASTGPVAARMPGIALADGRRNEQIPVRNEQSKRVIRARVTAPGQVSVAM